MPLATRMPFHSSLLISAKFKRQIQIGIVIQIDQQTAGTGFKKVGAGAIGSILDGSNGFCMSSLLGKPPVSQT